MSIMAKFQEFVFKKMVFNDQKEVNYSDLVLKN